MLKTLNLELRTLNPKKHGALKMKRTVIKGPGRYLPPRVVTNDEMTEWMEEKDYESVEQMKGSMSQANCPDSSAFERGNYMKALQNYTGEPI